MEAKLQELTQKIYQEGVDSAKQEAEKILNEAKVEAEKIIEDAKKEAEQVKASASQDAAQLDAKVKSELKMAGEQAMTSLKQEITGLLAGTALSGDIKSGLKEKEFVKDLVKEIVSKWDAAGMGADLNVILPEKSKKDLEAYFKKEAADILKKGVELKFESRMDGGFKISPKDASFVLSFTDKDFESFFMSFLRPKTKEILFPGA